MLHAGLFYDGIGNEIGTEMAMLEANKLNQGAAVAAAQARRDEEMAARERSMLSQEPGEAGDGREDGTEGDGGNLDAISKGQHQSGVRGQGRRMRVMELTWTPSGKVGISQRSGVKECIGGRG